MFRALKRLFSGIIYLITFGLVNISEGIEANPGVVKARYEEVIRDKKKRIQQYMSAVAEIITILEKKKVQLKQLTEDVGKLTAKRTGAGAMAKKAVAKLQAEGKSVEEIKADPTVQKCQSAFKDFGSTLVEKEARIDELEIDITGYQGKVEDHKRQLTKLQRDIDKIRAEKGEAVADIITAQEEKKVADLLTGISEDGTSETLEALREQRQKAKAQAKVAEHLAGTDTAREEAEFLEFAEASESDAEFDALLGLDEPEPESPAPVADKVSSSLPE